MKVIQINAIIAINIWFKNDNFTNCDVFAEP